VLSLLLVDDSDELRTLVKRGLDGQYRLTEATNLTEARAILRESTEFALIVLDMSLPDGDGLEFFQEMRTWEHHRHTPVIFLTSHKEISRKVKAFSAGAADYVEKPFSNEELAARIASRLATFRPEDLAANRSMEYENLLLDTESKTVTVMANGAESEIKLTALEFQLLHFLAAHPGQVFSRETLIDRVWTRKVKVVRRAVDVHLSSLNRKLKPYGVKVENVRSAGYRLPEPSSKAA